jgi:hypothetical protein
MAVITEETEASTKGAPLIVDMGKQRRKLIRQLREGEGQLLDEVNATIQELKTAGTIAASAQPVIVLVQAKRKNRSSMWPFQLP